MARHLQQATPIDFRTLEGCYRGEPNILPTDLDGLIERRGFLSIKECKRVGTPIPLGQEIALQQMSRRQGITITVDWIEGNWSPGVDGKALLYEPVERARIVNGVVGTPFKFNLDQARAEETRWFDWVTNHPEGCLPVECVFDVEKKKYVTTWAGSTVVTDRMSEGLRKIADEAEELEKYK